ncbi:MAG: CoA activase [Chloroflexi bacterium]|nr:CoA activase [Chloroflexota bacterium]
MITAGIDMGAKNLKVVILRDGQVIASSLIRVGFDTQEALDEGLQHALAEVGLSKGDIQRVVATGAGRNSVPGADDAVTEVRADSAGITHISPTIRTVIDVGAEEGRAVRCNAQGKVVDFAINEKCAAGAGAFTEAMARALEVPLEELGALSLKSQQTVPMNAQCAVFAESEVVSLIHARTSKEDIARAVHDAIASRITSMARRVGVEKDVALVGGVARNKGFVDSLRRDLDMDILVPPDPEFVGALGAALIAAQGA